jgi:hypothetical protein
MIWKKFTWAFLISTNLIFMNDSNINSKKENFNHKTQSIGAKSNKDYNKKKSMNFSIFWQNFSSLKFYNSIQFDNEIRQWGICSIMENGKESWIIIDEIDKT